MRAAPRIIRGVRGRCFRLGLVSLLGFGCSVGSIDDGQTFGDPNTVPSDDDEPSTSGAVLTTGVTDNPTDPSDSTDPTDDEGSGTDATTGTSGPDSETASGSDAESSSGVTSGASTGATVECGNGIVEADEACDGDDVGVVTCADIGTFVGGVLACDLDCSLDTSGCMERAKAPVEVCQNISLAIPDAGGAVTSTVTLPDGGTVADATIGIGLTHTYIGDLTVDVEHGGTTVRVYDQGCGTEENMDLVFDDAGAALSCATSTSGAATLPSEALSSFDGAAAGGVWTFSFQDNAGLDTGTATEICVAVVF